jgi:hypothetical protein
VERAQQPFPRNRFALWMPFISRPH